MSGPGGLDERMAEASALLRSFLETVDCSLEGDHPERGRLVRWLDREGSRQGRGVAVPLEAVRAGIAGTYAGRLSPEEAASEIAGKVSGEGLALFVVDAFNRGWITLRNLGLDDDGNVI